MDITEAPEIAPGYPYKRRLYPAWQAMWTRLQESGDFLDGKELSSEVARGRDLAPATLQGILARAAVAGILDSEIRQVTTAIHRHGMEPTAGKRSRAHYRIAA